MKTLGIKKMAILFATASILGFLLESVFVYAVSGHFRVSGNHGLFYQLYGFCAIALYYFYIKFKPKTLVFFIILIFAAMFVEFSTSLLLENLLGGAQWSYCDEHLDIMCRTTLARGVILAGVATFYIKIVAPITLQPINEKFYLYTCYIVSIFILADTFIGFANGLFNLI